MWASITKKRTTHICEIKTTKTSIVSKRILFTLICSLLGHEAQIGSYNTTSLLILEKSLQKNREAFFSRNLTLYNQLSLFLFLYPPLLLPCIQFHFCAPRTRICLQLNGAVLPCGSTLVVQPANFEYTSKKTKQKQQQQQKPSQEHQQHQIHGNKTATNNLQQQHTNDKQHISSLSSAVISKNIDTTSSSKSNNTKTLLCDTKSVENDDDLDDFFSSL